jgi:hypothetical protein
MTQAIGGWLKILSYNRQLTIRGLGPEIASSGYEMARYSLSSRSNTPNGPPCSFWPSKPCMGKIFPSAYAMDLPPLSGRGAGDNSRHWRLKMSNAHRSPSRPFRGIRRADMTDKVCDDCSNSFSITIRRNLSLYLGCYKATT